MSKSRISFFLAILLSFISVMDAFPQIQQPIKWSFSTKKISDSEAELVLTATIDKGWHLYSQFLAEGGPIPTRFVFTESPDFKIVGKTKEPTGKEEFDQIFEMNVRYFDNKADFRQKIKVLTPKAFTITGTFEYMTCNDETCIPFFDNDFEFKLEGYKPDLNAVAQPVEINSPDTGKNIAESAPAKNDSTATAGQAGADNGNITAEGKTTPSLWGFFFVAFLAGLAAILTPCVFPMIPMTVTFFMHSTDNRRKAKFQAVVYGMSIITIYTVIGTLVAVTLGANFANWLSTHWIPNVFFFLIFMIFAASFLGMFEITLPSWMINKADKQADKGGISGAFFMAFTLVLVSFSCTGPLVGAILVESAGGQVLKPIVGMFGFSLAFALPFTLFALFPSWLNNLPKSGGWLNSVKVVLGFLELALGLKFLSIADQTYHWGILDREVYLAFWIVIFALMGSYLLGKLKFSHDSDLKYISVPRVSLAIITFAFVVYMIPGMFGAPLKALSGYLPPQSSHDFDINAIIRDNAEIISSGSSTGGSGKICDEPRFAEFLHLPHGLKGYFDYEQGLACAKEQNKPIFIDFTGHGCVNCREMEANVWSDPAVIRRLQNDYVVIALYVDDKTTLPESEWVTSTYDGKVKKTLGKKYADLQITRFNVNAQPYYVLLDHNGELLHDPRAYDLDINKFVEFLDNGLAEFKKRQGNL